MIHIMVVEDVDAMRGLLEVFLRDIPNVKISGLARNTFEARLELTRRRPDLVLLDEVLPGESSLDLLAELKSQQIPVLLMTGIEEPKHPLPAGAILRVAKPGWATLPEDRETYARAIATVLGRSVANPSSGA